MTVLVHEMAHALVWLWLGATGVRVGLGQASAGGGLPDGTERDAMMVLGAGPAASVALAALGVAIVRSGAARRRPVVVLLSAWLVAAAASNVAWSMVVARSGSDAGRLLRLLGADGGVRAGVELVGIAGLVLLGGWLGKLLAASGIAPDPFSAVTIILGGWLLGVVLPLAAVVERSVAVHAAGAGFFVVPALLLGGGARRHAAASGWAPTSRSVLGASIAWAGAWAAASVIERSGGIPVG